MIIALPASAVTVYDSALAPTAGVSNLTFGTHLLSGPHSSAAGVGGGGLDATGSTLDGSRTYIYDRGASANLSDGIANCGDTGFAMMIWDMGAAFDSLRLYTHQDHYSGGAINDAFTAQDVMEYSVWGSVDGDNFILLSDVVEYTLDGGGPGLPTYAFSGTKGSVIYRGGSTEFGVTSAYTLEYVFRSAYQYFGIRASTVSVNARDADPELDAIGAFNIQDRPPGTPGTKVPLPSTVLLLGLGIMALRYRKQ